MISAVIPDPDHPEFSVFWLRDACLVYHPWLNELTVFNDTSLRPQMDDVVHALTRTQQVVSLAGNIFTGGIEEAVFDLQLNMLLDPATRIGSPAAGTSIFWLLDRVLREVQMALLSARTSFSSMRSGWSSPNRTTVPGSPTFYGPSSTSTSNGYHLTGTRAREIPALAC